MRRCVAQKRRRARTVLRRRARSPSPSAAHCALELRRQDRSRGPCAAARIQSNSSLSPDDTPRQRSAFPSTAKVRQREAPAAAQRFAAIARASWLREPPSRRKEDEPASHGARPVDLDESPSGVSILAQKARDAPAKTADYLCICRREPHVARYSLTADLRGSSALPRTGPGAGERGARPIAIPRRSQYRWSDDRGGRESSPTTVITSWTAMYRDHMPLSWPCLPILICHRCPERRSCASFRGPASSLRCARPRDPARRSPRPRPTAIISRGLLARATRRGVPPLRAVGKILTDACSLVESMACIFTEHRSPHSRCSGVP